MFDQYLYPNWPTSGDAYVRVKSCMTTRAGGHSLPPYDSFNLALHVGDDPVTVAANRAELDCVLPSQPIWLNQVHGIDVVDVDQLDICQTPVADAAVTTTPGRVLAIMTADCLPILMCDEDAKIIGIAHAGWRGLCAGVVENTIHSMLKKMNKPDSSLISAYLGPAIGPQSFEVGPEVRAAFIEQYPEDVEAFVDSHHAGKYLANLYNLATRRLRRLGVQSITGGDACTFLDEKFYSYRRNQRTGRMASFIWITAT